MPKNLHFGVRKSKETEGPGTEIFGDIIWDILGLGTKGAGWDIMTETSGQDCWCLDEIIWAEHIGIFRTLTGAEIMTHLD